MLSSVLSSKFFISAPSRSSKSPNRTTTSSRIISKILPLAILVVLSAQLVSAVPSNRLYYAVFREDGDGGLKPVFSPVYRFLNQPSEYNNNDSPSVYGQRKRSSEGQKTGIEPVFSKKYDRNCFFSPVQCMLSFKESGGANDDAIWNSRGRR